MKNLIIASLLLLIPLSIVAAEDTDSATRTLVWSDGTRYVGGVEDGKRSGKGTIFWQDGTRFVGQFVNDMRNGPGTMIMPDGKVYSGIFKDDALVDTTTAEDTGVAQAIAANEELESPAPVPEPAAPEPAQSEPAQPEPIVQAPIVAQQPAEEMVPSETEEPTKETISLATTDEIPEVEDLYRPVSRLTDDIRAEVTETVDLWGAAWSEMNVPQYLDNYTEGFAVPGNLSRRGWEALRRSRLSRPRYIDLEIAYEKIELIDDDLIDVFFRQTYRSNPVSYTHLTLPTTPYV